MRETAHADSQPITGELALKDREGDKQPKYTRLTHAEERRIVRLAEEGLTQMQIAEAVGRAQSTISDVLSDYTPTTDLAKLRAEAAALQAVSGLVNGMAGALADGDTKPTELVLELAGLRKKGDEGGSRTAVQVVVGMPGQQAYHDPFSDAV